MSERTQADTLRLHLRFGWWSLLFFLLLGLVLETMHGLKIGWYVDVSNSMRRLMWTLAHAHGTLIALIHLVFALVVYVTPASSRWVRPASACLIASTFLLPGGFFLGGVVIYAGDPGVGVFLTPLGAAALLVAVYLAARNAGSAGG